jgi:hypothetical protein
MTERREAHRALVRDLEEKRPLGRHVHRWDDNNNNISSRKRMEVGID